MSYEEQKQDSAETIVQPLPTPLSWVVEIVTSNDGEDQGESYIRVKTYSFTGCSVIHLTAEDCKTYLQSMTDALAALDAVEEHQANESVAPDEQDGGPLMTAEGWARRMRESEMSPDDWEQMESDQAAEVEGVRRAERKAAGERETAKKGKKSGKAANTQGKRSGKPQDQ
jgi:hypothetical protein